MIGIYAIKNKINNKVYVGQSYNVEHRWKYGHRTALRKNDHGNDHLQSSWNKYGEENFEFLVLKTYSNFDANIIDEDEKYWIAYYNATNPNYGYNILEGGQTNYGKNNPMYGRSHSKEVIEATRTAQTGRKTPIEIYERIRKTKKENSRQFSDQEMSHILQMRNEGGTYGHIANHFGVCFNTIRKIVFEHYPNTPKRKVSKPKQRKKNFKLSDEQVKEIFELLNEGKTYKFISEKFEVSSSTIKRIRMGTYYEWVKLELER